MPTTACPARPARLLAAVALAALLSGCSAESGGGEGTEPATQDLPNDPPGVGSADIEDPANPGESAPQDDLPNGPNTSDQTTTTG